MTNNVNNSILNSPFKLKRKQLLSKRWEIIWTKLILESRDMVVKNVKWQTLSSFRLLRLYIPIIQDLSPKYTVKWTGNKKLTEKQQIVGLLNGCEDSSKASSKKKKNCYSRQLTCVTIFQVFNNLQKLQNQNKYTMITFSIQI